MSKVGRVNVEKGRDGPRIAGVHPSQLLVLIAILGLISNISLFKSAFVCSIQIEGRWCAADGRTSGGCVQLD